MDYEELNSIAKVVRTDIFRKADKIFISFVLENYVEGNGYWATIKYEGEGLKTEIHGLTIEQEKLLIKGLRNEKHKTIGMWVDETTHVCSSMILLYLENEPILETNYFDGSKSFQKLVSQQLNGKVRYDDFEPNSFDEYFVFEGNGVLNYYSEEGLFRSLKPFIKKNIE